MHTVWQIFAEKFDEKKTILLNIITGDIDKVLIIESKNSQLSFVPIFVSFFKFLSNFGCFSGYFQFTNCFQ